MAKRVKVLELLPGLNYGGAQTMIINLCKNIDFNKVQCDFAVDHADLLDMKELVESLGSNVYTLPSFTGTNLNEITKAWDSFFAEHDYDIIHSHIRSYSFIILNIARKHGVKTIIHSHNTSNGKGLGNMIRTAMQYPLRKVADYFFACSKEAGEWLYGKKITKGNNFYVINNAVDTDLFTFDPVIRNKYRNMFGLKDEKVFIQIGRMSKQKNYLFTLDVFKTFLTADNLSKLFIVGDGELENEIRDRIKQLNLESNVVILQHRDDVCSLLQMADLFLMPSLYEGLSVACVEAQSTGVKCLCSENVDQNVNITGLCEFLSLDEKLWVKALSGDIKERRPFKEEIISAGFDAKTNGRWLEDFYRSIV